MGFKLKGAPYDKNDMNIGVYKQNLTDGSVGKSNHTGIIIQNGIDPLTEKAVIAHEKVHQIQQQKGELDYDDNNFYWKGKTYPRENLNEHNENLPWEKEAYKESNKQIKDQKEEMGSNKFKLGGHRGNNSPFKHLMERGLVGPELKSGSSMNPGFDKLPKSVQDKILKKDGASMMDRYGPSAEMCGPGGGGGDTCDMSAKKKTADKGKPGRDKTKRNPRKPKEKQYLVKDEVVKVDKKDASLIGQNDQSAVKAKKATGKATIVPGSGKFKKLKDINENTTIVYKTKTKAADAARKAKAAKAAGAGSKDGQTKEEYVNTQTRDKKASGRTYDKLHENSSEKKTGSIEKTSRYKKKSDFGNLNEDPRKNDTRNSKTDKFKRSVTSTKGRVKDKDGNYKKNDDGSYKNKNLTGTSKTKNKIIGKGTKTKSYRLKNSDNTDSNSKAVGAKKLERKDDRYTRKVTGAKKGKTSIGKKIQRADKLTTSKSKETTKVNFDKKANKITGKENLRQSGIGSKTKETTKQSKFNKTKNSKPKIKKRSM